MAFTYGFYNAVNHDRRYDAIQMGQIFDGIISDGIYATYKKAMIVIASTETGQVIVQPGRAWFNHTWSYNDTNLPVNAPDPEIMLDRIDALVLDINSDLATRANTITWVTGEPSSQSPARPVLAHTDTHNQYALCYIYRKADTFKIDQADITNVIGTMETPFVTGIIDTINTDDLIRQWGAEWENYKANQNADFTQWKLRQQADFFEWMENQTGTFEDFRSNNYIAWTNWFQHLQDELDTNQAGNLQAQIDAITYMYVQQHVLYLPNTAASVSDTTLWLTNFRGKDGDPSTPYAHPVYADVATNEEIWDAVNGSSGTTP